MAGSTTNSINCVVLAGPFVYLRVYSFSLFGQKEIS